MSASKNSDDEDPQEACAEEMFLSVLSFIAGEQITQGSNIHRRFRERQRFFASAEQESPPPVADIQ